MPPSTRSTTLAPDMAFSTAADILYRLERVSEGGSGIDTFVVGNVMPTDIQALEAERETSEQRYRFSYFANTQTAILTAPTAAHEQMHLALYIHLMSAMCKMDVLDDWQWTASTTVCDAAGSSGEADTAGSPVELRKEEGWPTFVVQSGIGHSGGPTMRALRQKARWWFTASQNQVNVVLLVSISAHDEGEEKLRIEKWTDETAPQQTIDVVWIGPGPVHEAPLEDRYDPQYYRVEGGPLELKFTAMFLRKPKDGEHDIVLSEGELQDVAVRVFSVV